MKFPFKGILYTNIHMATEVCAERVGDTLDDFSDCQDLLTPLPPRVMDQSKSETFFAVFSAKELTSIVSDHRQTSGKRESSGSQYVKRRKQTSKPEKPETHETTEADDDGGISTLSIGSYNTSSESANPVRVTGPSSHLFQKRLMCASSDYTKTKLRNTRTLLINLTQNFTECVLPMDVVERAAQRYFEVQSAGTIIRGNVHMGAMMTCLMRMCDQAGIHKKRDLFARMGSIGLSDLSAGERLIDAHVAEGRLKREDFQVQNSEMSNVKAYCIQYFLKLGIVLPPEATSLAITIDNSEIDITSPNRYYQFVLKLIHFTIKMRVADNSVAYSKCAGAIHVLVARVDLDISVDKIAQECEISKSTFRRFSNVITELLSSTNERELRLKKKLVHLFNKYNIPVQLK